MRGRKIIRDVLINCVTMDFTTFNHRACYPTHPLHWDALCPSHLFLGTQPRWPFNALLAYLSALFSIPTAQGGGYGCCPLDIQGVCYYQVCQNQV